VTKPSERIISRIRKLLALASSPNEHEAALAASRAQEFLDKYNLDMATVKDFGDPDEQKKAKKIKKQEEGESPLVKKSIRQHDISLWCGLARVFDCVGFIHTDKKFIGYTTRGRPKYAKTQSLLAVGHALDVEVLTYTYTYLRKAMFDIFWEDVKNQKDHWKSLNSASRYNYRWNFFLGCAHRLVERVEEQRSLRLADDNKCTALVVQRKEAVTQWVKENMRLKYGPSHMPKGNYNAAVRGRAAGNRIALRDGLKGSSKKVKQIR